MDVVTVLLFVIGLALLILGADLLVRGAARLAAAVGLSPLVIGLTVVAYGTSSPELAVSAQASRTGQADLALGNVIGSNIFNVLFILGISALICPLIVSSQLVRLDVPIMIGASGLTFLLALDGRLSRVEGILLLFLIAAYTGYLIRQGRRKPSPRVATSPKRRSGSIPVQIGFVLAGLAVLVLGSRWLVNGAVEIAEALGVSRIIIGLTVVAVGTSLPEIATSVVASIHGEREMAVGNVVGSNIFNLFGVLGLAIVVSPSGIGVPGGVLAFDLPVMLVVAVACLPIFFTGRLVARWEGGLFVVYYLAYALYLILEAIQHDALEGFSKVMLGFVLPLTTLTLGFLFLRAIQSEKTVVEER
jgi:cation:H+ antiporter